MIEKILRFKARAKMIQNHRKRNFVNQRDQSKNLGVKCSEVREKGLNKLIA